MRNTDRSRMFADTVYLAVRKSADDGHEFVDVGSCSHGADICKLKADEDDAKVPAWAGANRVVRIVRVEFTF